MTGSVPFQLLADAVLVLHVGIVVFVVAGLLFVILGNRRHWGWVNDIRLRLAHLAAIGVVAGEAWFGVTCPLTTFEMWLRVKAGAPAYGGSFIEYWLQRVLYYDLPSWVFMAGYSLFGLLVLATWWYFPPVGPRGLRQRDREVPGRR
jgi:polyferredoxin